MYVASARAIWLSMRGLEIVLAEIATLTRKVYIHFYGLSAIVNKLYSAYHLRQNRLMIVKLAFKRLYYLLLTVV